MNRRNLIKSLLGGALVAPVLAEAKSVPQTIEEWYVLNKNAKLRWIESDLERIKRLLNHSEERTRELGNVRPQNNTLLISNSVSTGIGTESPRTMLEIDEHYDIGASSVIKLKNAFNEDRNGTILALDSNGKLEPSLIPFSNQEKIFRLEKHSTTGKIEFIDCISPCLHYFTFLPETKITLKDNCIELHLINDEKISMEVI